MQIIYDRFFLIILFTVFTISCGEDKKNSLEPESNLIIDQALVGTWELSKISTTNGLTIVFRPSELADISFAFTFNSDGNYSSTRVESDSITIETGLWNVSDGLLIVERDGEKIISSSYNIDRAKFSIVSKIPLEAFGQIPATLEFSKRM